MGQQGQVDSLILRRPGWVDFPHPRDISVFWKFSLFFSAKLESTVLSQGRIQDLCCTQWPASMKIRLRGKESDAREIIVAILRSANRARVVFYYSCRPFSLSQYFFYFYHTTATPPHRYSNTVILSQFFFFLRHLKQLAFTGLKKKRFFVVLVLICLLHYLFSFIGYFHQQITDCYESKIDWGKPQYGTYFLMD